MASDLKALEERIGRFLGGALQGASVQGGALDWRTAADNCADEIIRWVADAVEDATSAATSDHYDAHGMVVSCGDAETELARLRAALAGAEQATTDARRLLTALATAVGQYHDTETRSTERENELRRALGEAEYDAWEYLRADKALAADVPAAADLCGSCNGSRWVDDQNWQPEDYERARGRVIGSGRIPCGICNHGGWSVPDGADVPAAPALPPGTHEAPAITALLNYVGVEGTAYVPDAPVNSAVASRQLADDPEALARRFHEAYERLAPSFGYETREASAKPWAEVPENNRRLMTAVCAEILAAADDHYLSTACYHGHHGVCGKAQHANGDPSEPHCKFCETRCSCPKHTDPLAPCAGGARKRRHHPSCARPDDDSHLGWCGPNAVPAAGEAEA